MSRLPGDPNAVRKLLFALGFRLPDRNREWVRHELTDAGWRGRLTVRHLLVTLPLAAALAAFPVLVLAGPAVAISGQGYCAHMVTAAHAAARPGQCGSISGC